MNYTLQSSFRSLSLVGGLLFGLLASLSLMGATVVTGFESTDGAYTVGANIVQSNSTTVSGVADTTLGGTWASVPTWSIPSGVIIGTSNAYAGSSAMELVANATGARGAQIQAVNAASLLSSPFTFSLAMNVHSGVSSGTGLQVQVQLGSSSFGNSAAWVKLGYDNGNYYIQTTSAGTESLIAQSSVSSALGEYVVFSVTVDPTTKTYTSASLTGSKGTFTFNVAGSSVVWDGTSSFSNYVSLVTGSNDTVTVDFDNISISSAVPEPTSLSLACGGGLLLIAAMRCKRRRSS